MDYKNLQVLVHLDLSLESHNLLASDCKLHHFEVHSLSIQDDFALMAAS